MIVDVHTFSCERMVAINRTTLNKNEFGIIYGHVEPLTSNLVTPEKNGSFHSEEGRHRKKETMKKQPAGRLTLLCCILMLGLISMLWKSFSVLNETKDELSKLESEFIGLTEKLIGTEKDLKSSQKHFFELKMRLNAMNLMKNSFKGKGNFRVPSVEGHEEISDSIISRQEALTNRVLDLQKVIQNWHSKQMVQR